MFNINEIFDSVQFEGIIHHGKFARFLRLAGCNLNCPWCDTDYTPKYKLEVAELALRLRAGLTAELIVLTGGEPTIQDLETLIDCLNLPVGSAIQVETNGSQPNLLKRLLKRANVTVTWSPKAALLESQVYCDMLTGGYYSEIKTIWKTLPVDFLQMLIQQHKPICIQPLEHREQYEDEGLLEFLSDNPTVRCSFQAHKALGWQ